MKKTLAIMAVIALLGSPAYAAFFVNTTAWTNDIDSVSYFKDFTRHWSGEDDQTITLTFSNAAGWVDLTTYSVGARISQPGVTFVSVLPADITIDGSNITFDVARTNVPPPSGYDFEVRAWEGAATNLAKSILKATINVDRSLYSDTDAYPYPGNPTNLTDYLLIATADTQFVATAGDTMTGTLLMGTNTVNAAIFGNTNSTGLILTNQSILAAIVKGGDNTVVGGAAAGGDVSIEGGDGLVASGAYDVDGGDIWLRGGDAVGALVPNSHRAGGIYLLPGTNEAGTKAIISLDALVTNVASLDVTAAGMFGTTVGVAGKTGWNIINTTQLVFIADTVTNVIDADITTE